MPLTSDQKLYAMYVIGAVESNWTWTSVNYNDPITIGMLQWYGTRAAALLNAVKAQDPDGYALLADTLRADIEAHAANEGWWTSRYLTRTEGNSWVSAADRDENHVIQQNTFFSDLDGYESTMGAWGVMTDTPEHVKTFVFYCSMYHQSPARCGRICSALGGTASIDRLLAGCLNDGIFGNYKSRYNRVHSMLSSWDGVSAPPDFGQVEPGETLPGGEGESIPQAMSQIHHIRMVGDGLLAVFGKDNEAGLLCYPAQGGYWYPQRNSAAPETPTDPSGPSEPLPDDKITQMQNLWRENKNKWRYGQGAGRLNPPSSGYADCTGCIWWAVNEIDPAAAASMTASMATMLDGNGTIIKTGLRGQYPTENEVHVGDLLIMNWVNTNIHAADGNRHVEWVFPDYQLWGAGSAPLPHPSGDIKTYLTSSWSPASWALVRHFS